MRSLYNPGGIFKAFASLLTGGSPKVEAPRVITPVEDKSRSQEAANAAREEERRQAAARSGASSTLISSSVPSSLLASTKKTLGSTT